MLFTEVLEQWWLGQKLVLRDISVIRKRTIIEWHIIPYFGKMEIINVDDIAINNFIAHELTCGNRKTGDGLCSNSVRKEIEIVNAILDYAFKKNYIIMNPASLVPKPRKSPTKEFGIFTYNEVQKLICVARPHWMGDIILLAYNTGMRRCECYGLQWDDIDFSGKLLCVKRSVTATEPHQKLINEPKSQKSKRTILLDDVTIEMLQKRYSKRTSNVWVFANQFGELLSPWYNVKYFRDACVKAGVSGRRFYDLRHTHITELVEAGGSIPVIQQRAGHSNINMTMHYTHIFPSMQGNIVGFLNNRNKVQSKYF